MTLAMRHTIAALVLGLSAAEAGHAAGIPVCDYPFAAGPPCVGSITRSVLGGFAVPVNGQPPLFSAQQDYSYIGTGTVTVDPPVVPVIGSTSTTLMVESTVASRAVNRLEVGPAEVIGNASSDLRLGQLKAYFSGNGATSQQTSGVVAAYLADVIYVTAPSSLNEYSLTASIDVSGTVLTSAPYFGDVFPIVEANVQLERVDVQGPRNTGAGFQAFQSGTYQASRTFELEVTRPFDSTGPTWGASIYVGSVLRIDASLLAPYSSIIDFGNSAHLRLALPDGLAYSSESGVLLAGPVPEPSQVLLIAVGLLFIAGIRRYRVDA